MVTTLGSLFLYFIYKQPEAPNFQSLYQSLPWSVCWGSFFHVHSQSLHKPLTSVANTACWLCHQQTIDFNCSHHLLACHQQTIEFSRSQCLLALPSANCWVQLQLPSVGFDQQIIEFSRSHPLLALPSDDWLCLQQTVEFICSHCLLACHQQIIEFSCSHHLLALPSDDWLCHQQIIEFSCCHHLSALPLAQPMSSVAVFFCWFCHHVTPVAGCAFGRATEFSCSQCLLALPSYHIDNPFIIKLSCSQCLLALPSAEAVMSSNAVGICWPYHWALPLGVIIYWLCCPVEPMTGSTTARICWFLLMYHCNLIAVFLLLKKIQLYCLCVETFAFWPTIYIKTFNKINNKTSTTQWNMELKNTLKYKENT